MANNSATGGFLAPVGPHQPEGDAFEDDIQAVLVGIVGLPPDLVRPRWQPNPPPQPPVTTDWAAVGITEVNSDSFPAVIHSGAGDGSSTLQRHETVDLLVSFYGPNGRALAARLRDGLAIAQNREALFLMNMGVREIGKKIVTAAGLVNEQWVPRYDLTVSLRRRIDRTYSVLNLLSAQGAVHSRTAAVPFKTPQE